MSAESTTKTSTEPAGAPPAEVAARRSWFDRAAQRCGRYHNLTYALFAMWCTLYIAAAFYSYLLKQTGGVWSAPLDDVFIHFDYARSFARGYPFQWSEGNGYSSGNTSLTYPIVLAIGYWGGFRGLLLMIWAATVASLSVYVFLVAAGKLVTAGSTADRDPAGGLRWTKMLIPPAVLSLGALDWTLFSGMENAFHLGIWGLCLVMALRQASTSSAQRAQRRAWALGLCGALLIATRPESGICVAGFAFYAAWRSRDRGLIKGWREGLMTITAASVPALALLLLHALANRVFTGEWSAAGSIAKLFMNDPFMSGADKLERYGSLLSYILVRLSFHHFSAIKFVGLLIPLLALIPLASRRLRPVALLLWFQLIGWLLIVALNNQLRWHNARYAMPSVAWLLILAALGVGYLAARHGRADKPRWLKRSWPLRALLAAGLAGLYWVAQAPRMQDQIWFFGRASRNILDQHVSAGMVLKKMGAKRILVGDAGAITYASDRPGLDLIGLGGMGDYPIARATRHGLGATLEQIERMPVDDRPDMMALYPSWWGDLPLRFGSYLTEIPVRGNVICGGAEKVLYRADWHALDRRGLPRTLARGLRVVDQLDVAELVSERAHDYRYAKGTGFVRYRVLADPGGGRGELFDAGRIINNGHAVHATLTLPASPALLMVRVAPDHPFSLRVKIDQQDVGVIEATSNGGWQELSLPLPAGLSGKVGLALSVERGNPALYHLWVVRK